MLASAAAGAVLEMSDIVHRLDGFCFFILRKFFVFALVLCQAASRRWLTVSALVPMAQMKPSSSRATAVTIFLWSFARWRPA